MHARHRRWRPPPGAPAGVQHAVTVPHSSDQARRTTAARVPTRRMSAGSRARSRRATARATPQAAAACRRRSASSPRLPERPPAAPPALPPPLVSSKTSFPLRLGCIPRAERSRSCARARAQPCAHAASASAVASAFGPHVPPTQRGCAPRCPPFLSPPFLLPASSQPVAVVAGGLWAASLGVRLACVWNRSALGPEPPGASRRHAPPGPPRPNALPYDLCQTFVKSRLTLLRSEPL